MLYTQATVRDNLRNRQGKRVFYLGKGDTLTPGARDWLRQERVEILPAEMAKQEAYRLPGGGSISEKPEHWTHLNSQVLVPKHHPRIRFRGAMDTLEGALILAQLTAGGLAEQVGEVLALARRILRCEVLDEPVGEGTLCGLTQTQQRQHSHRPQDFYGQPHFMPEAADGEAMARLNLARCAARQAELAAVEAFTDRDGAVTRGDILQSLNRMSSMLYILMVKMKVDKMPPKGL